MNGSPPLTLTTPTAGGGRRLSWWALVPAVALIAVPLSWVALRRGPATAMPDGKFHSVTPVTLDVTVLKDGELQAVENIDVQCMVEGRTTIVHIVKEGTRVKKGDLLVELDSSLISQALLTSTLEKKQA